MRKCVPNEDLPINASHCWDYSYYWWHISRQNLKMIPHPLPSHLDDSAQVEELLIVYMLLKSATSSCRANVRGPPPTGKSGSRQSCLVSTAAGDGLLSKKMWAGIGHTSEKMFLLPQRHMEKITQRKVVSKRKNSVKITQDAVDASLWKWIKSTQKFILSNGMEKNKKENKEER